jgi:TPR repeat protein
MLRHIYAIAALCLIAAPLSANAQTTPPQDPAAQYQTAMALITGLGAPQDKPAGFALLRASADSNYGPALYRLGQEYAAGSFGAKDIDRAFELYVAAGEAGTPDAYVSAGRLQETGQYSSGEYAQDNLNARYMYELGATSGSLNAMRALAKMDETAPLGVPQNLASATYWYQTAYERGPDKTQSNYNKVKEVSSKAYHEAVSLMQRGEHWDAYHQFEALCDLSGPGACYWLGMYRGATNSPYGFDLANALEPLSFACDNNVENACQNHAKTTGLIGPSAGVAHARRAERYFLAACNAPEPDNSACFNIAHLNYYTGYGLNNWQNLQTYSARACLSGGYPSACSIVTQIGRMMGPPPGSRPQNSGGNWGRSLDNAIGGFFAALASGADSYAATGSVGSSTSTYRPSPSYSNSNSSYQSNRDWNDALRATSRIGTAYSSSCRPGNPYC